MTLSVLLLAAVAHGQGNAHHAPAVLGIYRGHSFTESAAVPRPDPLFTPTSEPSGSHSGSAAAICASADNCDSCEPICEACCVSPCDETGRRYAVDIGAVFLFRDNPKSQRLFVNPITPAENINAGTFHFGATAGIEAGLIIYEQHDLTDIEVRAMWMDDWVASIAQSFTGNSVQFDMNPPVGTSGPRTGLAIYGSEFFSSEINVRFRSSRACAGTTWILGYRIMRLDEFLNANFIDPAGVLPDELLRTTATNRLAGLQLGGDRVWKSGCDWCVQLSGRVGVYGNDGENTTRLISLVTPPVAFPAAGSGGKIAWHGELGLSGRYRLSSCVNLTASYRLMYLDGLALASEQLAATSFITRQGFTGDGSLLLHGATVGLEVVY